jgi:hypothetical protein
LHWELFSLLIRAIKFFSVSGITSFQLLTPKLAFAPDSIEAAPTSSRHFLYCFDLPAAGAAAFPSVSSECIIPRTGDFFMKFKIFLRPLFYASRPRTVPRIMQAAVKKGNSTAYFLFAPSLTVNLFRELFFFLSLFCSRPPLPIHTEPSCSVCCCSVLVPSHFA